MHRRTASRTALILSILVAIAAGCGADEDATDAADQPAAAEASTTEAAAEHDEATDHDHGHDHDHDAHAHGAAEVEETPEPVVRLAIADPTTGQVAFVDVADPAAATTLDVAAPATGAATTEDGRFVVVRHEDAVTVLDGGSWSEPHGDHDHHFVADPTVVGEVAGDHPSHLVSHHGRLALFFDGTGEAVVLDEHALAHGELDEVDTVVAAAAHHGFALPVDGAYVVTDPTGAPEGELPQVVGVTDEAGTVTETFPCPATHGEAGIEDGAAAACGDGILLVQAEEGTDDWAGSTVAYPTVDDVDPYGEASPRAWSLQAAPEGDALVGVLGSRHLVRVDVAEATAVAVDVGAPIAGRGLALLDDGTTAAVLGTDGVLRLVDTVAGTVTAQVEVMAAFEEGDDDIADRQVVVSGDTAWITDPTTQAAVEVALGDSPTVARSFDLPVVPGSVQVIGG